MEVCLHLFSLLKLSIPQKNIKLDGSAKLSHFIESSGHLAAPFYGPLILPRTIHSQRLKQQTSCDTDMAMLWASMGCRWGDLWRDEDEEDGKPAPITLW